MIRAYTIANAAFIVENLDYSARHTKTKTCIEFQLKIVLI